MQISGFVCAVYGNNALFLAPLIPYFYLILLIFIVYPLLVCTSPYHVSAALNSPFAAEALGNLDCKKDAISLSSSLSL